MACSITNGRVLPCKSAVGGLKSIYFSNYDSAVAALTPSAGEITFSGTEEFYQYEIKGNSSLETAINSSRENGTTFYESTLNATFTFLDKATQEEIKLLSVSRPHIAVEDYNGNFFLVGLEHGAEVTGGSITSGAAMADASAFTLTFEAMEKSPANFTVSTVVTSNESAVQIDPNA